MVISTSNYETHSGRTDIVVFSHLRWDSVTQRPQHIMTRLARDRKIFFVEEPIAHAPVERGTARSYSPTRNITVIQPRLDSIQDTTGLAIIVQGALDIEHVIQPTLWFYTPMFADIERELTHGLVVYDCMDELSLFHGAPPALVSREKELFAAADVVFTGGRSLYEAKRAQHENVHCFPSSVDRKHFQKVLQKSTSIPDDMQNIPGPRALFYGVIDERMDLELVGNVARIMPHISFVLLGPIVKIDPTSIPRLPNIYLLGNKPYDQLPAYLKGADVTIMPFAHNESTRFISPTKTLEFMAAHKPIVSTSIRDVVRPYSHVVALADTAEGFAAKISAYLKESAGAAAVRIAKQKAILNAGSWDQTVKAMERCMNEARVQKDTVPDDGYLPVPHAYLTLQI